MKHFIEKQISNISNINYKKYINDNILFLTTVLTLLFNATLLRFVTVKNFFAIKPLIADLAIILFVCSFGYYFKPKKRIFYYMTVSIIMTAICVINSVYYTFYMSFVSVSLIMTSLQIKDVGDAVVENVLQIKDFFFLFQPLIVLFVHVNLLKNHYYVSGSNYINDKANVFKTMLAAGVFFFFFMITLSPLEISRLIKQWNREFLVMKVGVYTYQLNDIVRSLEPKISTVFGYETVARKIEEYYTNHEVKPTKNKYTNIFKGKNIITIHAESIQQFVMDLEFNNESVTPNLNKLASEGLYFDNFYAQVGVGTSSDTEFTLNTSLLPVSSGTVFVSYWDREFVTIPKLLKEKGYYSFSMHGNNGTFWNRLVMHKQMGYDKFYHKADFNIDEVIGLGLSDKSFFRQAIPKIKEIADSHNNFYGTMIMLTNHTPFNEVDKYEPYSVDMKIAVANESGATEMISVPYMEGTKLGDYFKSVHYADAAIGEFIKGLDEAGLLEDTVIVVYGDHDARLSKKDYIRLYNYDPYTDSVLDDNDPNYIPVDYYSYELNRKVPFIIWTKDKKVQGKIDEAMGMYNVLPTLGNMFGFYSPYQLGEDIFSDKENMVPFPNGNWLTNKIYYNNQKQEYLLLNGAAVSQEYIDKYEKQASDMLEVSNDIIMYDYIRRQKEKENLMQEYKG